MGKPQVVVAAEVQQPLTIHALMWSAWRLHRMAHALQALVLQMLQAIF
jgi:hypothetical protein